LGLTWVANARSEQRAPSTALQDEAPIGGKNGFAMMLEDRYLLLIAAIILVLNLVNTTGESILDMNILQAAKATIDPSVVGAAREKAIGDFVGEFRGDFFLWVNLIGAVVQLFFVSRIFKYLGVRVALLSLPFISLFAYGIMAVIPALALVRLA